MREDLSGIGAREVSGLGNRVEELTQGGTVDREVIDGFVGCDVGGRRVRGLGKHRHDRTRVGTSKRFALVKHTIGSARMFPTSKGGGRKVG